LVILCALAALALALTALFGAAAPAAAGPSQQIPTQPPSARSGQPIYQENCAPCHGVTGLGDGPTAAELPQGATALADPLIARQATPADWFQVTKEGRMALMMPPWQNRLSDQQIWDVTAYALTLHSSEAELAQGETVWGEQCAACHGPIGAGDGAQAAADGLSMPNLADPAFTAGRSLDDWYTVTSAGQDAMPGFAGTLSDEDIRAVVAYARSFTFAPVVAAAAPAGEGQLSGQVLNGTTGQPVQALVTLNIFDNFEALQAQEVQSSADGSFSFANLPTGSQYAYLLSTAFGGASFGSDILRFGEGVTTLDVPLRVYDASATPGEITVSLAQWFVDTHQGALLIGELYRINHDSDTVYTGSEEVAPGKNAVLRFNLPPGATSVALDGGEIGERFIRTAEGVVDTQPLAPGGAQILLRYLLPHSDGEAELAHSVPYPIDRLNILVVEGPEVTTELQSLGPQTVADQQWNSFEGANLAAGQPISLRLAGLTEAVGAAVVEPANASAVVAQNPGLLFGVGVATLLAVLAVLGAYLWLRPAAPAAVEQPVAAAPAAASDPTAERQRLLASIAHLDDLYVAGEIEADSYRSARAAQKRSLVLATRQLDPGARSETGPSDELSGERVEQ
jgi:mono/diheme cytochrome c family protein